MSSRAPLPGYEPVWQGLPAHLRAKLGVWVTDAGTRAGDDVYGFNTALHVGDHEPQVLVRRQHLADHLGVSVVWLKQVHGVECADASSLPASLTDALTADAAFSVRWGQAVGVMTADCLPVLLVNSEGTAVAAAHCGWRGLLNGVLENTVLRLRSASCAASRQGLIEPAEVYACFGPAIGPASFEVGAEVREAYLRKSEAYEVCFSPSNNPNGDLQGQGGKFMADLYGLAGLTLSAMGGIEVATCEKDTFTDPRLFSYRRSPVTGRMVSLIWLKG